MRILPGARSSGRVDCAGQSAAGNRPPRQHDHCELPDFHESILHLLGKLGAGLIPLQHYGSEYIDRRLSSGLFETQGSFRVAETKQRLPMFLKETILKGASASHCAMIPAGLA